MIASIHELFKAFSGGQFQPVYTGQFQPVKGGAKSIKILILSLLLLNREYEGQLILRE
jgi:hypothetical protein